MSKRTKYLLDTNICIFYMKNNFGVKDRIEEAGLDNCYISDVTLAELYFGAANSGQSETKIKEVELFETLFDTLPIKPCLKVYGKAKAYLKQKGILIDDFDLLIGSTAVANGLVMVTENVKHISRIEGIIVENWVSR